MRARLRAFSAYSAVALSCIECVPLSESELAEGGEGGEGEEADLDLHRPEAGGGEEFDHARPSNNRGASRAGCSYFFVSQRIIGQ